MKWPSLDESFSVCSCLLTVACNSEIQRVFFLVGYLVCVGGGGGGGGLVRQSRVRAGFWL